MEGTTQIQPAEPAFDDYITADAAAEWAGVSARTMREWYTEGRLSKYKIEGSRTVLLDKRELVALVKREHEARG
jgi:excisionase family DNA binding protein